MKVVSANLKWKEKLAPLKPDEVKYIVVHHAALKEATVEAIHKAHIDQGWAGIGYNEYIRKNGTVYICRGDHIGAHTKGWNSKSYGICVEGNYDEEAEMPEAQFDALVQRIAANKARFANLEGIKGHKDFMATTCPGKNFPMDRLLKAVELLERASEIIYTVQVGAFKDRESAERLAEELRKKGFAAFVRADKAQATREVQKEK